MVVIVPHKVANGSQRAVAVDARVPGGIVFAGVKGSGDSCSVGGVGVAVCRVICSLVWQGDGVAGGRNEAQVVVAGGQVVKEVRAAGVGGGCGYRRVDGVVQHHAHVFYARFAKVLNTVAVVIVPHKVAQRGCLHKAEVGGEVYAVIRQKAGVSGLRHFAGRFGSGLQGVDHRSDAAGFRGEGVYAVFISVLVSGFGVARAQAAGVVFQRAAGGELRGRDVEEVVAGSQVVKLVEAAGGGGGGEQGRRHTGNVGAAEELHFYAGRAVFIGVKDAVVGVGAGAGIKPNHVANGYRAVEPKVYAEVALYAVAVNRAVRFAAQRQGKGVCANAVNGVVGGRGGVNAVVVKVNIVIGVNAAGTALMVLQRAAGLELRSRNVNRVVVRGQAGEEIASVGVGSGDGDGRIRSRRLAAAIQFYAYAGDARFCAVLEAVVGNAAARAFV